MSNHADKPPKLRVHEVRFNPTPKLKKPASNLPPTVRMNSTDPVPNSNPANLPSAQPTTSANPASRLSGLEAATAQSLSKQTPPTAFGAQNQQNPATVAPQTALYPQQPIQALAQIPRPLSPTQTILGAAAEEVPTQKKLSGFWKLCLFGLPILVCCLLAGLFLWDSTRASMYSFFPLTAAEANYYEEVSQLNSSLDNTLNQAYTKLLTENSAQQAQGYTLLYTEMGQTSARFLAIEDPSFRFNDAHLALRRSYMQFELISKRVLADLNQKFKNIDRQALLAELDTIRKSYERARRQLKTAANL